MWGLNLAAKDSAVKFTLGTCPRQYSEKYAWTFILKSFNLWVFCFALNYWDKAVSVMGCAHSSQPCNRGRRKVKVFPFLARSVLKLGEGTWTPGLLEAEKGFHVAFHLPTIRRDQPLFLRFVIPVTRRVNQSIQPLQGNIKQYNHWLNLIFQCRF